MARRKRADSLPDRFERNQGGPGRAGPKPDNPDEKVKQENPARFRPGPAGARQATSRKVSGKRVVHALDLACWLDEQRATADDAAPAPTLPRRRPGRPTKLEQRRAR